jgi:hypothetical protein
MITEQQLKADCTPEIIKKMVELAEGFEIDDINIVYCGGMLTIELKKYFNFIVFPLLIHRAVEEWNKITRNKYIIITDTFLYTTSNLHQGDERYNYNNYQPQSLTPCECACLHCLIEVLK